MWIKIAVIVIAVVIALLLWCGGSALAATIGEPEIGPPHTVVNVPEPGAAIMMLAGAAIIFIFYAIKK